jgi:4-amino-4-deoxy-L-arabinose transferase-like glycosyltransferase
MLRFKNTLDSLLCHPRALFLVALAYLPFLGDMSVPLTGDQKVYISISLEMMNKGSWLKPILFGQPSYYKPPLQYWSTIFGWRLAGFNLWGTLLPSLLVLLATALFLGLIVKELDKKIPAAPDGLNTRIPSAFWFAATIGALTFGTTAQMEIYICAFYAASWWAGLKFLSQSEDRRNWCWLYLAFVLAGFSALVKSPLYSVFWVISFLSYLWFSGERGLFRDKRLYFAWCLGILAGAAWFAALMINDGSRFWSDYLMRETWEKKTGNSGSPLSIWLGLIYFALPFTFLLLPAVKAVMKVKPISRFLLCWLLPPALFFTLYPYRVKTYLFILVPALALSLEWGIARASQTKLFKAMLALSGSLVFVSYAAIALFLVRLGLISGEIAAGFFLVGAIALLSGAAGWVRSFVLVSLVSVTIIRGAAVDIGEADIAGLRAAAEENSGVPIAMLDDKQNIWHEAGLLSTAIGRPIERLSSAVQAEEFLRKEAFVVLSDEQAEVMLPALKDRLKLKVTPWLRWKSKMKFPFGELLRWGVDRSELRRKLQREFVIITLDKDR